MKLPRLRTILLTPLVLFALVYIAGAVMLALQDDSIAVFEEPTATYETIAIFGASGTAGDVHQCKPREKTAGLAAEQCVVAIGVTQ